MNTADMTRDDDLIARHQHDMMASLTWGERGCQLDDCPFCLGYDMRHPRIEAARVSNLMRYAAFREVFA